MFAELPARLSKGAVGNFPDMSFCFKQIISMQHELNEEEIRELYAWIDNATFSRPKRNLARDFSDGG
jgi:hypothetical protein